MPASQDFRRAMFDLVVTISALLSYGWYFRQASFYSYRGAWTFAVASGFILLTISMLVNFFQAVEAYDEMRE